jgi:phosphomethylpyrimidine synthase
MTQLEEAIKERTTKEMRYVAGKEDIDINILRKDIANGLIVIPANKNHKNLNPIGIGKNLSVKVNANIGASPEKSGLEKELEKLRISLEIGTDTIMDLTILKNHKQINEIRKAITEKCLIPLGTVPIYQTAVETGIEDMNIKNYLDVFEKNAKEGIDFTTVHAGITKNVFPSLEKRLMKCVSRGGSFLIKWMKANKKENFLYEYFNEILDIAKEYDITLSLGDGLRPGCIADSTDKAQIHELRILGELVERCREKEVQVMVEGPGHIPLNEIEKNIKLEKQICKGAPFYVLGPLPCDIAVGYDHIAGAIGGALAAMYGADFLCYLTPREHIGLPNINEVKEGIIITKLAAHIADLARGNKKALERNKKMAEARKDIDWDEMKKYVFDLEKFISLRKEECIKNPDLKNKKYCSICGEFCALR